MGTGGAVIKKLVITAATAFSLIAIYSGAWIVSSLGIFGEIPFGYYRDFYLVKHAIKDSYCANSITYNCHEDITLENFHFTVRTKSNRLIRLWFIYNQDVSRICSAPKGIFVVNPGNWRDEDQIYNIESLADQLGGKDKVVSIQDILCNIDNLVPLFETNYCNAAIPLVTGCQRSSTREFRSYLRLEIVNEELDSGWIETPTE
jgi:hypothetical protein